jgi:cyclic-di-GMP phosphodiesterase, flagellum assembly factor TipF
MSAKLARKRMRLGAIFVAVCMVLIAGSAGAVVYLGLGFRPVEAITVSAAVLIALTVYNLLTTTRSRVGAVVGQQLVDLSRASADLARQVAELGRRLAAMESKAENVLDRSRAMTDPLATEVGELGTLIKQLAETVAAHESTLSTIVRGHPAPAAPPPSATELPPAAPVLPVPAAATDLETVAPVPAPRLLDMAAPREISPPLSRLPFPPTNRFPQLPAWRMRC